MLFPFVALAVFGSLPSHQVALDHGGTRHVIKYEPIVNTSFRTVGSSVGSRASNERCRWSATISVVRSAAGLGEPAPLPGTRTISGSHPGHCSQARSAIEARVAASQALVRTHLLAIAEEDLPSARADLELGRGQAGN
jgi:hypothetical protein